MSHKPKRNAIIKKMNQPCTLHKAEKVFHFLYTKASTEHIFEEIKVYCRYGLCLHKLVKCEWFTVRFRTGGESLKQQVAYKHRKMLESKMASVFGEKIQEISTDLQKILLDDMVTAFENRLKVLNQVNLKLSR